ncbi:hypothetical protein NKH77_19195 [Streptomyces sp. M19]
MGDVRLPVVSPSLAELLPDLFHPDGTRGAPRPRREGSRGVLREVLRQVLRDAARAGQEAPVPEPTPGDYALACGCLLFIVGVIIGVIFLILNWSSVSGYFASLGRSDSPPRGPRRPSPRAALPHEDGVDDHRADGGGDGDGARLVAVYGREKPDEEFTFCRTKKGKLFYFARTDGNPYGVPREAERAEGGYAVRFPPYRYRFSGTTVVGYKDGKEFWKATVIPGRPHLTRPEVRGVRAEGAESRARDGRKFRPDRPGLDLCGASPTALHTWDTVLMLDSTPSPSAQWQSSRANTLCARGAVM